MRWTMRTRGHRHLRAQHGSPASITIARRSSRELPVSDKISVRPANSILNRLQKLLVYLVKQDPDGGWGEFVADGQPVWSRIVVAGHSQGAGHAAYLGKMFPVDKVLMFSGPQDYFDDLDKPAPWLARPSATPPSRYLRISERERSLQRAPPDCELRVLMGSHESRQPLMVEPGQDDRGKAIRRSLSTTSRLSGLTGRHCSRVRECVEYLARMGDERLPAQACSSPGPASTSAQSRAVSCSPRRGDIFFEMRDLRRAGNGQHDRRALQEPRQTRAAEP